MPQVAVLDSSMSYVDTGGGTPFVFLHGNPTSSHIWRRVLPQMGERGRFLAPDLIGMGGSGKPPIAYRFDDHARYLDAWFDALALEEVVLIGHDWGGALAFDWAARHPGRTRGIAFMETIVRPMSWDDLGEGGRDLFKLFRTPEVGEAMVLDQNVFIEQALPRLVGKGLADDDLDAYRRPYPSRDARLPLLQWPREMPLDGVPADVVARVEAYDRWLASSPDVPKLLLAFEPGPGTMMGPDAVAWCALNISGLETVRGGPAGHQVPEDQPEAIAVAITAWADRNDLRSKGSPDIRAGSTTRNAGGLAARDGTD